MYAIHAQAHISSIFGPIRMNFGSMPKIKFYDHLIFYLLHYDEALTSLRPPPGGGGRGEGGSKTLVTDGQNQLF